MGQFLRGIGAGLFGQSQLSTWLMVLVAAISVSIVLLSPLAMARALGIFPGLKSVDDYAYAYMRAVEERETKSTEPTIYLLGASTAREALRSEAMMAELVSAKLGEPVRVLDLTTSAQPLWLGNQIGTTAVCGDGRGVVLVAVNMRRARAYSTNDKADVLNWPNLDETEILKAAKQRAEFLNSVLTADLSRTVRDFLRRPLEGFSGKQRWRYSYEDGRHRYLNTKYSEKRVMKSVRNFWNYLEKDGPDHIAEFFQQVDQFAKAIRSCSGAQIVLADSPLNPEIYTSDAARAKLNAYGDFVRNFAEARGMAFVSLPTEVHYEMSDFIDHGHLRTRDAMERSTIHLAEVAADVLLQLAKDENVK